MTSHSEFIHEILSDSLVELNSKLSNKVFPPGFVLISGTIQEEISGQLNESIFNTCCTIVIVCLLTKYNKPMIMQVEKKVLKKTTTRKLSGLHIRNTQYDTRCNLQILTRALGMGALWVSASICFISTVNHSCHVDHSHHSQSNFYE